MSMYHILSKITRALLPCVLGLSLMSGAEARVIRNDSGGVVSQYARNVDLAILTGEPIRIEGWCASACTLYLSSPQTCVTPRATLAFHSPRGGSPAQNAAVAREMAARLPRGLGAWYLSNAAHLNGRDYAALSGAQLIAMGVARACA